MGMILITDIDGALLDHLHRIDYRWRNLNLWYLFYWLLGTGLALWAFVYIVDARNGIGLSTILYSFWFVCAIPFFIRGQLSGPNIKSFLALFITGFGLCLIIYFGFLQITVNNGWHTLIEDTKVAVQIERYPNWQNPAQMGYPKREDGQVVTSNTYERVAWATAGSRATSSYPQDVSVLAYPFAKHPFAPTKMAVSLNSPGIATQSGWVELGLEFGIPILGLIFLAMLLIFIEATPQAYPARMTVLGL